jgi:hypothetical protein
MNQYDRLIPAVQVDEYVCLFVSFRMLVVHPGFLLFEILFGLSSGPLWLTGQVSSREVCEKVIHFV